MDEDGVRQPGGPAVRYGEIKALNTQDMVKAGIAAGNIFVQSAQAEVMELPQVGPHAPSPHSTALESQDVTCKDARGAANYFAAGK
jgi:hypothetical protein